MNELYKAIDKRDSMIEALKVSNHERQIIIDDLVAAAAEKDNKIEGLNQRIKEVEGILNIVDK